MTLIEFRTQLRKLSIVAFFIADIILAVLALKLIFTKC
jgi:hypothetical protein